MIRETRDPRETWKRIWGMCVPPKVRVFWWRVVNGFLPTRGVLHRRHIELIPTCEMCGAADESIKHVLMDCTVAKSFWREAKKITGVKLPELHPLTWAHDLVDPALCPPKDAAIFLCGMWSLWMSRNMQRHGEKVWPMRVMVQWVTDLAFDLWQIAHPPEVHRAAMREHQHWQKPDSGWIKCNVDASFYDRDRTGSSGVVLRDHEGRTCGGTAKWYDHSMNALTTEARACLDGMLYAQGRGVRRLILQTDCQVLVNLWDNRSTQKS